MNIEFDLAATIGGILELTIFLKQIWVGDFSNVFWIPHGLLFLVLGISLGSLTVLRSKSVRISARGLVIDTWLRQLDIAWEDIKGVQKLPFRQSLAIRTRFGWFILGTELKRFDELRKLVLEKTNFVTPGDKKLGGSGD